LILLVFTKSYPYDLASEHTFLSREVPHLQIRFDRVVFVPQIAKGKLMELPSGIEVDEGYAQFFNNSIKLFELLKRVIRSSLFYSEIQSSPGLLIQPIKFLRLLLFCGNAEIAKIWIKNWLQIHNINTEQVVLYSYWFEHIAMGLSLLKDEYPNIVSVTRAHGYDIYEEDYFPYYWPCRQQAFKGLDEVIVNSEAARDYLIHRYPEFSSKIETRYLGVGDPGYISEPSKDNHFRVVSCSHIIPLKRVDLLCEGVARAARLRPNHRFSWHHFGDGNGKKLIQEKIEKTFPINSSGLLHGNVMNIDILDFYKNNSVDVFVNLSTTEGVPVSIMEAISCGIPAIATNVGGNPEIVSERNGILLSTNPTSDEVAQALLKICDQRQKANTMRHESRRVWEENFKAEYNFRAFAERLLEIRQRYLEI